MPNLQAWVVYNKNNGDVNIVKGKRLAERITVAYNKVFHLLNKEKTIICIEASDFFSTHFIDKNNINFGWDISTVDKMHFMHKIFKRK